MTTKYAPPSLAHFNFAASRRRLKLAQGQQATTLEIERDHLSDLVTGQRPVYQLYRPTLEQLRWQMAESIADLVEQVLADAWALFESVGYRVATKSLA